MALPKKCRNEVEAALRKKLPFDDDILEYLFKVARSLSAPQELLEIVNDFCPRWSLDDQAQLASKLLDCSKSMAAEMDSQYGNSQGKSRSDAATNSSSWATPPVSQPEAYDPAADELLARMLQEEEEADAAFRSNKAVGERGSKKNKKGFRPLNINYTVGHNASPASLGTAAPSCLADLLRTRRAQEQRPPDMTRSAQFGPPARRVAAPDYPDSGFGPPSLRDEGGLSWAERAQIASEKAAAAEAEAVAEAAFAAPPAAVAGSTMGRPSGSLMTLRLLLGTGQQYTVNADRSESIGDVKSRVEKLHGISVARQRIFHMGRELADGQELRTSGVQEEQPLQLALRGESEVPRRSPPAVAGAWQERSAVATQPPLHIRLQLPNKSTPTELRNVPASTTVLDAKRRIEKDHGIRHDHLTLSFFGRRLQDNETLGGVGIANGGLIDVALCPPGVVYPSLGPGAAGGQRRQEANMAELQTSEHGRVLTEDEALELALAASQRLDEDIAIPSRPGALPVDDGSEQEGMEEISDFLTDVALQDDKLQALINHAKRVGSSHFSEDFIAKVSKRSGYRLILLVEKVKKPKKLFGYMVYRFRRGDSGQTLNVCQLAVVGEQRGRGFGCHMVKKLISYAKKNTVENVAISCLPESVAFYERNGFRKVGMKALEGETFMEGQVYMEHTCRKEKQGSASQEQGKSPVKQGKEAIARRELISSVFCSCDRDSDGVLSSRELRSFAHLTGFAGDDAAWAEEFRVLCSQYAGVVSKVDMALFTRLVEDQSDDGCYCTDMELQDMLSKLRAEIVRDVFHAFDTDGNGVLNQQEMRRFAVHTGFDGDDSSWANEYDMLCSSYNGRHSAISQDLFQKLVDDETDDGCYCTNEELRDMLSAVQPVQTPPSGTSAPQPRLELVREVFRGFDTDADSFLNQQEMRRFAGHTGFEGDDGEWAHEYSMLCSSYNGVQSAISMALFEKLVDDESDEGCYCTDEELRAMLPVTQPVTQPAPPPASSAVLPAFESQPRVQLVREVFCAFDTDRDGNLNQSEMRQFAGHTGFDGDDAEWAHEYNMLCAAYNGVQSAISLALFAKLVDDETDDGCYCTDEELRDMLSAMPPPSTPHEAQEVIQESPPPLQSSTPAPNELLRDVRDVPDAVESRSREEIVQELFICLDVDRDGFLNSEEMRRFAGHTGFEGDDALWASEYHMLCSSYNSKPSVTLLAIDIRLFMKLADDESEEGCYCTDEELRDMLAAEMKGKTPISRTEMVAYLDTAAAVSRQCEGTGNQTGADDAPQVWDDAPQVGVADSQSRAELVRSLFLALDSDGDGALNGTEMRFFAEQTGFEGTDAEWVDEYRMLCLVQTSTSTSYNGLVPSISITLFEKLVDDETDDGCYCDTDELRHILSLAQTLRGPQAPNTTSPSPEEGFPAGCLGEPSRAALIAMVFQALDADGDGILNMHEMRHFAGFTGFGGGDDEWTEEFAMICSSYSGHQSTITPALFARLVDDESDDGCYCTDDELRDMLARLAATEVAQKAEAMEAAALEARIAQMDNAVHPAHLQEVWNEIDVPTAPVAPTGWTEIEVPVSHEVVINSEPTSQFDLRAELVGNVFRAFDADADGLLNSQEMRRFAGHTGFEGDDGEWAQEYMMLCSSYDGNHSAISLAIFEKLVDDETDDGCYCTDAELGAMLSEAVPATAPVTSAPPAASVAEPVAPSKMTRSDLIQVVFRACDVDSDGILTAQEMRQFATHIGFEGSAEEWAKEFATLCRENGSSLKRGVDSTLFEKLVEDQSDNGCYCTTKELREMVRNHLFAQVKATTNSKVIEREEQVSNLFRALDSNRDGFLDVEEMRRFATCIGFSGDADEWKEEYAQLFDGSAAKPAEGVDAHLFANLVNDESAAGCFCTNEDLVAMITRLHQPQPAPVRRPPPANRLPPATRLPPGLGPPSPGTHADTEGGLMETTKDVAFSSLPVAQLFEKQVVAEGESWRADEKQPSDADADGEDWADWDQWKEAAAQQQGANPVKKRQQKRGGWQSADGEADGWVAEAETANEDAAWSGAQAVGSVAQWSGKDDSWWAGGNTEWSTRPADKVDQDGSWWAATGKDWSDSGGWQANKAQGKGNSRGKGRGKGKKEKGAGW